MIVLTHAYYLIQDAREQQIMKPYPPLGILSISAYLKEQHIPHSVYDSTFSDEEGLLNYLVSNNVSLLGIYVNLMTKLNVIALIEKIKSNELLRACKIVLGGPDIRYNTEEYLAIGADMLVLGEGEITFSEIARHFTAENVLPLNCSGTVYHDNNKQLVINTERPLVKQLDDLPIPNREAIDLTRYLEVWKKTHGYNTISISTMRGCPYTCKWCSRAVYGGSYRRRSAQKVVEELELLNARYAPDKFWFVDDVFTISHKWLREFCDEIKRKKVSVSYEIITRADRMNTEVIQLLKDSGCFRVWIGAESGSQSIINAMDRRVEVAAVRDMIIKSKQAGIETGTFLMLGYPGEKKSDIAATIKHLQVAKPDYFTLTIAYPIAGTPLYEENGISNQRDFEWRKQTDRDRALTGRHNRKYYEWGIRWVNNAVALKQTNNPLKAIKHRFYAGAAQVLMYFYQ